MVLRRDLKVEKEFVVWRSGGRGLHSKNNPPNKTWTSFFKIWSATAWLAHVSLAILAKSRETHVTKVSPRFQLSWNSDNRQHTVQKNRIQSIFGGWWSLKSILYFWKQLYKLYNTIVVTQHDTQWHNINNM